MTTKTKKKKVIKGNHEKVVRLNEKHTRLRIATSLSRLSGSTGAQQGMGFDGDRDLYTSVGWILNPNQSTYITYYARSVGKTVVDIKPDYTWNGPIKLKVSGNSNSKLPEAWKLLERKHSITNLFSKADKLAGILQYSVMMLGLSDDDAKTPSKPVKGEDDDGKEINRDLDLNYIKVFRQDHADILKINGDVSSPNYGKPSLYQIETLNSESLNQSLGTTTGKSVSTPIIDDGKSVTVGQGTIAVDATRVIHIAENVLEGDIYGPPRMEACLNNIQDLEKVHGGSAEMFYRGAQPGWAFSVDPDAEYDEDDIDDMDAQIDDMLLGLNRYIKLQGITPTSLAPQVSDPTPHANVQWRAISAIIRAPFRILIGSESGELASSQDADAWDSEINSRRNTDCERWIRDLVNTLMAFGILPFEIDYEVEWEPVNAQNEKLKSEIALSKSLAIKNYTTSINPEGVIPVKTFLTKILGFSEEDANAADMAIKEADKSADTFIEEDARIIAEAGATTDGNV